MKRIFAIFLFIFSFSYLYSQELELKIATWNIQNFNKNKLEKYGFSVMKNLMDENEIDVLFIQELQIKPEEEKFFITKFKDAFNGNYEFKFNRLRPYNDGVDNLSCVSYGVILKKEKYTTARLSTELANYYNEFKNPQIVTIEKWGNHKVGWLKLKFLNYHAPAQSNPKGTDETRKSLFDWIVNNQGNDEYVFLGDFNQDIITDYNLKDLIDLDMPKESNDKFWTFKLSGKHEFSYDKILCTQNIKKALWCETKVIRQIKGEDILSNGISDHYPKFVQFKFDKIQTRGTDYEIGFKQKEINSEDPDNVLININSLTHRFCLWNNKLDPIEMNHSFVTHNSYNMLDFGLLDNEKPLNNASSFQLCKNTDYMQKEANFHSAYDKYKKDKYNNFMSFKLMFKDIYVKYYKAKVVIINLQTSKFSTLFPPTSISKELTLSQNLENKFESNPIKTYKQHFDDGTCNAQGDDIYVRGDNFFSNTDVAIYLVKNSVKEFVRKIDKKEIKDGSFEFKYKNASQLNAEHYAFIAVEENQDNTKLNEDGFENQVETHFYISPCYTQEHKNNIAESSSFCKAFASGTGSVKNVVNTFSFFGELTDKIEVAPKGGCWEGFENLSKLGVTIGVEYLSRGMGTTIKVGRFIVKSIFNFPLFASPDYQALDDVSITNHNGFFVVEGNPEKIHDFLDKKFGEQPLIYVSKNADNNNFVYHFSKDDFPNGNLRDLIIENNFGDNGLSEENYLFETSFKRKNEQSLKVGTKLSQGDFFYDKKEGVLLIFQKDGNLVCYKKEENKAFQPIWKSGTGNKNLNYESTNAFCEFLSDKIAIRFLKHNTFKDTVIVSYKEKLQLNEIINLELFDNGFKLANKTTNKLLVQINKDAKLKEEKVNYYELVRENKLSVLHNNPNRIKHFTFSFYPGDFYYDEEANILMVMQWDKNFVIYRVNEQFKLNVLACTVKDGKYDLNAYRRIEEAPYYKPNYYASFFAGSGFHTKDRNLKHVAGIDVFNIQTSDYNNVATYRFFSYTNLDEKDTTINKDNFIMLKDFNNGETYFVDLNSYQKDWNPKFSSMSQGCGLSESLPNLIKLNYWFREK